MDLARSLESGDNNIVMTYRTSAPSAPPLRVVVSSSYVGGQWSDIVVFGILILFMLARPTGLLGSRAIQKV